MSAPGARDPDRAVAQAHERLAAAKRDTVKARQYARFWDRVLKENHLSEQLEAMLRSLR